MIYLLDTNAWVTLLRNKSASLSAKVHAANPNDLQLCSIVVAELLFGAHNAPAVHRAQNLFLVNQLRQQFVSLPFSDAAAEAYAVIRKDLQTRGLPIGPNDTLIAAIAIANDVTLVTHNTAEFSRVNGLKIEDWQIP